MKYLGAGAWPLPLAQRIKYTYRRKGRENDKTNSKMLTIRDLGKGVLRVMRCQHCIRVNFLGGHIRSCRRMSSSSEVLAGVWVKGQNVCNALSCDSAKNTLYRKENEKAHVF